MSVRDAVNNWVNGNRKDAICQLMNLDKEDRVRFMVQIWQDDLMPTTNTFFDLATLVGVAFHAGVATGRTQMELGL